MEPQKWLHYLVRAERGGDYKISAQVAAGENASAQIFINARPGALLEIRPGSQTSTAVIPLEAGLNVLRVLGQNGRFQLQSLEIAP